jgi:oligoendopeptidase F
MQTRLSRADVPVDTTWDLSDLFPDEAAWARELEAVDTAAQALGRFQGTLAQSAAGLLACLEAEESAHVRLSRLWTYAHLRNAQDGTHPPHQAATARVMALYARYGAGVAFIESEILAFPDDLLAQFMDAEPGLAVFRPMLDQLQAQRPHRLGADTERVLASLGEVLNAPYMVYGRAKSGDMHFAPFTDAAGATYANSFNGFESTFETHADASVRRGAWASFTDGLKAYHQTCAATFATETQKNVVMGRLRGHASTEDYLLLPHQIPRTVYNRILDIIPAELAPHMQRYARLRRRVLGLDQLLYCDIKATRKAAR